MDSEYKNTYFDGTVPEFATVLFLEIEGVLNSRNYLSENPDVIEQLHEAKNPADIEDPAKLFDPATIAVLNRIIEDVDPTVVLTASWRQHFTRGEIESFLRERGYEGRIDATIREGDQINPEKNELIMWSEQETDPDQFLVVDTRDLRGIQNLHRVDPSTGLTTEDADTIIDHFS